MKIKIVLSVFVLGAIVALSMFYLNGSAGATTATDSVSPSVTVSSILSLTLEDTSSVVWENKNPGTKLDSTIHAKVVANSNWKLTVISNTDNGLQGADGNNHLSALKFDSTAGLPSPAAAGSGVTEASFGVSTSDVWLSGEPTSGTEGCRVAIRYYVTIPLNQRAQQYTATHTYTLTSLS